MSYKPPFTLTQNMIDTVLSIGKKMQSIQDYQLLDPNPRLRKQNRIRSIYSSCAIEANSLSVDQVSDIINGNRVIGPEKDIREVRNAMRAYSLIDGADPYSMDEMLRIHGIMADGLIPDAGQFRTCGEGVFSADRLIFMAPPPELVPSHMKDLFSWLNDSRDSINPLIASSVFHYELVFIHPFTDGNGRIARLWQTAILGAWAEMFYWIPIENRIERAQDRYHEVINRCNRAGESTLFIEFMLGMILTSLEDAEAEIRESLSVIPEGITSLLMEMEAGRYYTISELMALMGMSSRPAFHRNYIGPALSRGLISMEYPDSSRSPKQRYRKAI